MTSEQFFDAFGQIDATYVLAVDEILAHGFQKDASSTRRKILRTALIAAVIAGLMTVTAYAAGLFGLLGRLIKGADSADQNYSVSQEAEDVLNQLRAIHHRDYISLSGVAGSPEYQAAAEWLAFKGAYAEQKTAEQIEQGKLYFEWRDLERSFAPDAQTKETCRLYQVWDAAMWEKLQEIAGKYELSLHSERTLILGDWNQRREYGQYEDGSFLATATTTLEQQFYAYDLYLERKGALPCDDMTASCADEYEEWEYKNAHGQSVSIAMMDASPNNTWADMNFLIFYSGDDVTVTIKAKRGHSADATGMDDELFAEHLADTIDFTAVVSAPTPEDALAILRGD